jgi:hypothetical protein
MNLADIMSIFRVLFSVLLLVDLEERIADEWASITLSATPWIGASRRIYLKPKGYDSLEL